MIQDLYDAVISSEEPFTKFVDNISKIQSLSVGEYKGELRDHLLGILYTNVITALETLYVELFIHSIEKDESYITECIEKGKIEFKAKKEIITMPFKGKSIEEIKTELIKEIREHLISSSWHNTDTVVKRFRATFGISLKNDWPIDDIKNATIKRNHLVHRGGKDKDGTHVVITKEQLDELIDHAMSLGTKLNDSLNSAIQKRLSDLDLITIDDLL